MKTGFPLLLTVACYAFEVIQLRAAVIVLVFIVNLPYSEFSWDEDSNDYQ